MEMDYSAAREYLASIEAKGNLLGLDSIRGLLRELGDPQDRLSFIHIAGTNGKGSAMAFLEQTLICAGYRVGRYISPSVFAYEEKIRVNGNWITKEQVAEYTCKIAQAIDHLKERGDALPTIFEVETAMSFLYFVAQECDLVLLEVGMGGAEDATNIVTTTRLAMFSSISMDHMEFLGDTLGKIATVKAGILKPGIPAVSDSQQPEAGQVLSEMAASKGCPLTFVEPERIEVICQDVDGQTFSYKEHRDIRIRLIGTYQLRNAALALEAVDALRDLGMTVPEEAVREGFAKTVWNGRFQILRRGGNANGKSWIVMDGAHNPDAAEQLMESLHTYFPQTRKEASRYIYVFGVFADKEYEKINRITAPQAQKIYTIQTPGNPRALPAARLSEAIRRICPNTEVETVGEDIAAAIQKADRAAGEEDVIVVFGSLSFLYDAQEAVKEIHNLGK